MSKVEVDLRGKVALITGSGSGIGRGLALRMASDGAAVVVTDLDGSAAADVACEITAMGEHSFSRAVDVTDLEAVEEVTADTITRFGQIDFLFANAGVSGPVDFAEITPQGWDLVIDVNVKGVVNACEAVVPHMMERRQGRILITASPAGVKAGTYIIPYRVSKAAVLMYTRCLALVMASHNVTVNAMCPGPTLTSMQMNLAKENAAKQGITLEEYLAGRVSRVPMQQFAEIEDLARLAEFLVSDSARLITGQAIAPDGGTMVLYLNCG